MFKRLIISLAVLCSALAANAQGAYDALRFSQQHAEGTARSVAMGNAFVALGGDMGGLAVNPASSAVYRYSEFMITPSLSGVSSTANYLGSRSNEGNTRFGVSNFGFVGSYNTGRENAGLVSWSFGLVINKMNSYTNGMATRGTTDASSWLSSLAYNTDGIYAPDMDITDSNDPFYTSNAPWNSLLAWNTTLLDTLPGTSDLYIGATENLNGNDITVGGTLDQNYRNKVIGNVTEATINFGGNFANKLFLGVNIGIQSISYRYEETYREKALNSSQFQTGFESFNTAYRYKATGSGINVKAGLIYLPTNWLRFGASISTPTLMYLSEEWENAMESKFNDGYSQKLYSPLGAYNYYLETPFRWNVGVAATLGERGVFSVDYESVDYSKALLSDADNYYGYADENDDIRNMLGKQNILRMGAEVNVTPQFAARAGYQFYSSPYSDASANDNLNIGSVGVGYVTAFGASSDFFIDLTYQRLLKSTEEVFSLYGDTDVAAPSGTNKSNSWKLLLSVGLRF